MTPPSSSSVNIQHDVPLAPYTTIGLGGKARQFASCGTPDQLCEALQYARDQKLPVHVLGGGSNVIFSDQGFSGLVVRIELKGVSISEEGNATVVSAEAGEEWDDLVRQCVDQGFAGIECLSGIPGSVGGTPIQNVGAYGQEVCQTIVGVKAIDRATLETREFSNEDCQFGYRQSIFKSSALDRHVVTRVTFRLQKNGPPAIRYPELQKFVEELPAWATLVAGAQQLNAVREAVLTLRRRKSMVLDPADPHSRSVGSFFTNPVLSSKELGDLQSRWRGARGSEQIPTFPSRDGTKVPAAWLVERAGFRKGYRSGNVGVSLNHSLALVNYGGTTRELLDLADQIKSTVMDRFGIALEREPVIVGRE